MFYRQSSQRRWFFSLDADRTPSSSDPAKTEPKHGICRGGSDELNTAALFSSSFRTHLNHQNTWPNQVEFRPRRFVGSDRVRRSVGVGVRPELRTLLTGFGPFSEIFIQKLSVSTIWTTDDFRRLTSSKAPKVYFKSKHVKYSNITQID